MQGFVLCLVICLTPLTSLATTSPSDHLVMREEVGSSIAVSNPLLNTALSNLLSFDYVNHGLREITKTMSEPVYRIQGIALSKNIFQYFRYFIEIDVHDKTQPTNRRSLKFLYQDASVQAHHNIGEKPWTIVEHKAVKQIFKEMIGKVEFNRTVARGSLQDPVELAFSTRTMSARAKEMNLGTVSVLKWAEDGSGQTYKIVSYMTEGVPYVVPSMNVAVVIRYEADGSAWVGEPVWLASDFLNPMEEALSLTADERKAGTSSLELLLRLSLVN